MLRGGIEVTMKKQPSTLNNPLQVEYITSPTWRIALAMLTNGSNIAFMMLVGYLSYVANQGYGIVLSVAGLILTATRIFDGLIDPFLALLIDRCNTRWGKIRIFMLAGWALRSLSFIALFVWFTDKGHGIIAFLIMYILYIIGSSTADIAGTIIPTIMSNDPKQRPMIQVWGTLYSYLVPTVMNIGVVMFVLPRFNNQYNSPMLATLCIIVVLASLIMTLLSCLGVSKIDKPETFANLATTAEADAKEAMNFSAMWNLVKGNRPFQMFILSSVAEKLGQITMQQALVATMLFGILIGNIQFGTILSTIAMLPSIICAIIGAKHAGAVGNRKATIVWNWVGIGIATASIAFCGIIDMKHIATNKIYMTIFFVLLVAIGGARMCVTIATSAMRADVVDYELYRSGKNMPGTITAAYNFVNQIISSFGITIATAGAALVGYVHTSPQPTDPATSAIKWVTLFMYFGLPMIGSLCGILAMKFYSLDKETMVDIEHTLEIRKKEQGLL